MKEHTQETNLLLQTVSRERNLDNASTMYSKINK